MDTTTNYGLSKPGYDAPPDIEVLGQNADIVDTELKKAQNHRENSNVHMSTAEKGVLNSAVQSATFGGAAVPQNKSTLEIPMPTAAQVGASNPNQLINSDFRNPINQRGQSSYSASTNCYSIDRWFLVSETNSVLTVNSDYITLSFQSGTEGGLLQKLEFPAKYSGKTLTASVRYRTSLPGLTVYSHTSSGNIVTKELISDGEWHETSITYTVPDDITLLEGVGIWHLATVGTGTIDLEWAKLEVGSVATPFSPRPYAEELAMCQRYYEIIPYQVPLSIESLISTSGLMLAHCYRVKKRVAPTVQIISGKGTNDNVAAWDGSSGTDIPVKISINSTDFFRLEPESAISASYKWFDFGFNADAEIY